MLRELKTGTVVAILIPVDRNWSDWRRRRRAATYRKQLFERHGILVITFADTNASQTRTPRKAKRSAPSRANAWPPKSRNQLTNRTARQARRRGVEALGRVGAPFGAFKLESVMTTVRGREEVDHCRD